jgi:hypothetical protein
VHLDVDRRPQTGTAARFTLDASGLDSVGLSDSVEVEGSLTVGVNISGHAETATAGAAALDASVRLGPPMWASLLA